MSNFLPTHEICAKENIHRSVTIEQNACSLEHMDIIVDGKPNKFTQILENTYTDSILVLRKGNVLYERYFNGMRTHTKHLLQSVSKSILGVLYAIMINKGVIDPEHGSGFQYCSATTDVLAWLISHVTGMTYAKLLERELWIPMGAQQNANITVDSAEMAVGNGCISCTSLDMAIFVQLVLNGGKTPTGVDCTNVQHETL